MLTIQNYKELIGDYVGNDGFSVVDVDELPTQYGITLQHIRKKEIKMCLERLGKNVGYELWYVKKKSPISRRLITSRSFISKDDIKNKWILLEHMDELLLK